MCQRIRVGGRPLTLPSVLSKSSTILTGDIGSLCAWPPRGPSRRSRDGLRGGTHRSRLLRTSFTTSLVASALAHAAASGLDAFVRARSGTGPPRVTQICCLKGPSCPASRLGNMMASNRLHERSYRAQPVQAPRYSPECCLATHDRAFGKGGRPDRLQTLASDSPHLAFFFRRLPLCLFIWHSTPWRRRHASYITCSSLDL